MAVALISVQQAQEIFRELRLLRQQVRNPQSFRPLPPLIQPPQGITFYNSTGVQIPANSFLAVTGWTPLGDGTSIASIAKPSTTFTDTYLLSGKQAVEIGAFAQAQVGPCFSFVPDSGTPANEEMWGPAPNKWTGVKGNPGFKVHGFDSSKSLGVGKLVDIVAVVGKTTGSVTALTPTTSYRFYGGTLGSETDAGFTTVPNAVCRVAVSSGKWVLLTVTNTGVEMSPSECPT